MTLSTAATMSSTVSPYSRIEAAGRAGLAEAILDPDELHGYRAMFLTTTSATALPRPPMTECSSAVTMAPVSLAAATISATSIGLIVEMLTTRTCLPDLPPILRGCQSDRES